MDLLNPLQVDDGHHAYQQVHPLGDVDIAGHHTAMQAFIEQDVGTVRDGFPGREGAGRAVVMGGLDLVVYVITLLTGAGLAVAAKQLFQLVEDIGFRAEVAEGMALLARLFHGLFHLRPVVFVETVAFHHRGLDALAAEDMFEGVLHRGGARPR